MNDSKKKAIDKRRWPWVVGTIVLLFSLWQVVSNLYTEEEKELRRQVRETVKETFPKQAEQFSRTVGLFPFSGKRTGPDGMGQVRQSVVLIHGLDDPGKVWQNLAPWLAAEGFAVWLMHYPNDQPIVESSQLLLRELKKLARLGVRRISIVAHSMGGLVSRDLLTSPDRGYRRLANEELVPGVDRLIMVGTPNHGSQLARFRVFGEVRDQFERLSKGQVNGLGFILDGAGEAKIDLLPGSRFLTELNSRPHPREVDTLIIAGISAPWSDSDIKGWLDSAAQKMPGDRSREIEAVGRYMLSMTHGLGDGLVTVESTRLPGVPHLTVSGTHLSMIRNITQNSQRVPPAVPIIVKRLMEDSSKADPSG